MMMRTRSYIICQRIQNNKHSSHNTICLLDNRLCIDALNRVVCVHSTYSFSHCHVVPTVLRWSSFSSSKSSTETPRMLSATLWKAVLHMEMSSCFS